jgi:hypothetical protein
MLPFPEVTHKEIRGKPTTNEVTKFNTLIDPKLN